MDRHPFTSRYAVLELERRFLVSGLPPEAVRPIRITDRYITGTNLRLRKMEDRDGTSPPIYKLAQKMRLEPDDPTRVRLTNMYIDEDEHRRLAALPADDLCKTRYSLSSGDRFVAVDVFSGSLDGLVLVEADFESEAALASFEPPAFTTREVSDDDRFSGGNLARASAEDLQIMLMER